MGTCSGVKKPAQPVGQQTRRENPATGPRATPTATGRRSPPAPAGGRPVDLGIRQGQGRPWTSDGRKPGMMPGSGNY